MKNKSIMMAVMAAMMLAGCATINAILSDDAAMAELDAMAQKWKDKLAELPAPGEPTPGEPPVAVAGDAVSFDTLRWTYGGFDGSKAVFDRVTLSDMRYNGRRISYTFDVDLSAWGLKHTEAGAVCAWFFKQGDVWEGGKGDWVSSSRLFRDINHVESYNNWPQSGLKLPVNLPCAFVIVSADEQRRSNVVAYGVK